MNCHVKAIVLAALLIAPLSGCDPSNVAFITPDLPPALVEPVAVPEIPAPGATPEQIAVALIEVYTALWDANGRLVAICEIVRGADRCGGKAKP